MHFHPLFQLQLMGLYGAFLTADLFNLFVFFEVLLAACYGLLMHGGGAERVRAGLHYIAINLMASLLFLIGVALLYGVTGTLEHGRRRAEAAAGSGQRPRPAACGGGHPRRRVPGQGRAVAVELLAAAGLCRGGAPVAALFVILTKVGVYAVLRLWTLCFPASAGPSALFGADVLVWGGVATLTFGAVGMMASQRLSRLAGFSIITSAGTLLAAIGFDVARRHRRRAVLSGQLDLGRCQPVPDGRS